MAALNPKLRVHETYPACPPEIPEPRRCLAIRDSLNITFYMRRPHSEVRHDITHALEVYCQAVGRHRLSTYGGYSEHWQALDDEGWAAVREDLLDPEGGGSVVLREWATVTPGHAFTYFGRLYDFPGYRTWPDESSTVSFWLPTEYLEERGPDWVRELALELASRLPFNSGHAGLFLQSYFDPMTHAEVRAACFAYPGMDIVRENELANHIGTRVKGAHWLTFLGQPVLGELGGATGLRSRLHSPNTAVQGLGQDRVVVTLGKQPEFGDVEPERTLAPYRELARVWSPGSTASARRGPASPRMTCAAGSAASSISGALGC
ncbi:type VI immunity family protein [Pyxidicoccus trucidator]|uniref:type VI immunity family protein n=1 Tax=Pyxidicoccus trucidator TaxID=2709662 RepID=UPI0013D97D20|nr:type VI immunity family protein [Pyxidicoccus trucidator]